MTGHSRFRVLWAPDQARSGRSDHRTPTFAVPALLSASQDDIASWVVAEDMTMKEIL